jgi:hypothetical protein
MDVGGNLREELSDQQCSIHIPVYAVFFKVYVLMVEVMHLR